MWAFRLSVTYLHLVVFLDIFYEADSKPFENFFIRKPRECEDRCLKKHGYFMNGVNRPLPVTSSKIKLKVKCSCKPHNAFKAKVVKEYGKWGARKFYLWSLVGQSSRARKSLGKIKFLTFDQYTAQNLGSMPKSPSRCASKIIPAAGAGAGAGDKHMVSHGFSGDYSQEQMTELLRNAMQQNPSGGGSKSGTTFISRKESEAKLQEAIEQELKKQSTA